MLNKIKKILSKITGCNADNISGDTLIKDIEGWDSLKHIKIILAIEETFDIVFKSSEIENFTDVNSIVFLLQDKS
ncbi:acyl carrier protein [Maridesulfovibrio hydrothermalis]|uniref:Putative Acyl carrier protein n=1 Tax=Maridesulfovibrio hydrothermalis AM13 = DSM 14728 TaxID=1121451 RepID=L0R8X3_9BACT|nr:acyl carrier protein [Maridesulfovibrio hydrothermalis]CCO23209.1 putative Acyl carrier protein [Maridesulfovibrio hydrothermalis AM13 = DSM 14728]